MEKNHHIAGMKVLIVEDNIVNLNVLRKALDELHLKITIAPDGETALNLVSRVQPDLILLDVMLPGVDGFEVCRQLRENRAFEEVPVIFLTALDDSEEILKGFSLGATDYIGKPFNQEEVLSRITTRLFLQKAEREKEELVSKYSEREKLYRTIVEKVPEIIFQLDAEKNITFANSAFRMLGYEPQEIVGKPFESLVESNSADRIFQEFYNQCPGPMGAIELEVPLRVNEDSTIAEQFGSANYLIDAVELWSFPDHEILQEGQKNEFLGTLCIGRKSE